MAIEPKVEPIDVYLAGLTADNRAALQALRRAIRAAAPDAEECISYNIPSFRLGGKLLVSFAAWRNHCAFYPGTVLEDFKEDLKDYDVSKATIRFPADSPPPATLVRKLVEARIARIAAQRRGRRRARP
jgi:uncharacterized protein YdhG (YjbR/CyaY superfamily)